jgi:ubiquinol-cytochrome c reductase cytochrome c1 subunit
MDPNTGDMKRTRKLVIERPGSLAPVAYDAQVADLVNYLAYISEPAQTSRRLWGILVLFFLAGFFGLALLLQNEYWKDVR